MQTSAILVAGGKGLRLGSELPKQFLNLNSKPVLCYSLELFEKCEFIHEIILVLPQDYISYYQEQIASQYSYSKIKAVVAGGDTRQASTQRGFESMTSNSHLVLVHDAARPLLSLSTLNEAIEMANQKGAVIVGTKAKDTIKKINADSKIMSTLNREEIVQAETPQIFHYDILKEALLNAKNENHLGTDEASLVEKIGKPVYVCESKDSNFKITNANDLKMAEILLRGN